MVALLIPIAKEINQIRSNSVNNLCLLSLHWTLDKLYAKIQYYASKTRSNDISYTEFQNNVKLCNISHMLQYVHYLSSNLV